MAMAATSTHYVHDRLLDAEERYEVFVVKAAERPHLLHWTAAEASGDACKKLDASADGQGDGDDDDDDDEKKVDDALCSLSSTLRVPVESSMQHAPPLTDGTDLPGWRCQRIAPCMKSDAIESPLEGTLNVGAGSTLLRRESQFPFVCSTLSGLGTNESGGCRRHDCWWYSAKRRFSVPPPTDRAAPSMDHKDAAKLVPYDQDVLENDQRKITMFCREYEIKNRPVKVLGAAEGWSAMPCYGQDNSHHDEEATDKDMEINDNWSDIGGTSQKLSGGGKGGWTFANLLSRFGRVSFRFSDTHGEMMSFQTYAKYITNPEGLSDDSPLGIYDSEFGDEDSPTSVLLTEYSVPKCFSPDLFDLSEEDTTMHSNNEGGIECSSGNNDAEPETAETNTRPPYRWILIGPERSGTGMHVDPLWTNAWVTILQGKKRWLLFPPDTPHESIGMFEDKPQIPSSIWFRDYYDKVTSPSWPKEYRPIEVLQQAGETVYVPAGWPHLVLNLELTVAVTHNYASEHGPFFERMWREVAQDEPAFAKRWYSGLIKRGRRDLASVAPKGIERAVA
ncbi:hypothetical protein ACHAWF_017276 [Thalassiosira exigua]